jgi:putative transposase
MCVRRKQSSASSGVQTIGSFSLNEVLSTIGTPVSSLNAAMRLWSRGFIARSTVWSLPEPSTSVTAGMRRRFSPRIMSTLLMKGTSSSVSNHSPTSPRSTDVANGRNDSRRLMRIPLARPPEIGPTRMRVLPAHDNGRKEDRPGERKTSHSRADHPQAPRSRPDDRGGKQIPEVAKALEVSENTLHRWRATYGGMKGDDVKRLKALERENTQLKRIVADKELENLALREISKGNF